MAKFKRTVIGSVVKNKDPQKPDYIKVNGAHTLTDGQYLNLESKKFQLDSLEAAIAGGKISGDNAEKAKERISKTPDFVRFQVVAVSKE